jgi:hypothetical protein
MVAIQKTIGIQTKDNEVFLCWIRLELFFRMTKFVDAVSQISSSYNGREICNAPKESEEPESSRIFRRSNVGVGSTESLLEFTLIEKNSGTR